MDKSKNMINSTRARRERIDRKQKLIKTLVDVPKKTVDKYRMEVLFGVKI